MKKIIVFIMLMMLSLPVYAEEKTSWHDKGVEYLKTDQFALAIDAFSKAMEQGNVAHNQYHRGVAYALDKQSKKALKDLNAVEKTYNHFFWLYYHKYLAHTDLGNYKAAKKDCVKMLNFDRYKNYGYHGLGFIALQQKDYITALENTLEAAKLDPNAGTYNNLGKAYMGLAQYSQAVKAYDKGIKMDSDYAVLYYNKAAALEKIGDKKNAIENYKIFLEKADNPDGYNTKMKKSKLIEEAQKQIVKLAK